MTRPSLLFLLSAGLTAVAAQSTAVETGTSSHDDHDHDHDEGTSISAISDCYVKDSTHFCMSGSNEVEVAFVNAPSTTTTAAAVTTAPPTSTTATEAPVTAVSECHTHGSQLHCMAGTVEYLVGVPVTQATSLPTRYDGCHSHGSELFCVDENGNDVSLTREDSEASSSTSTTSTTSKADMDCHFHAGVEHCVPKDGSAIAVSCERVDRDYDVKLRVGLLFVILATSAIGVFGPIFLTSILPNKLGFVFVVLKQFGTGVIISTALVHLLTHAMLMFENECLGRLEYESTATAIVMAGVFVSFLTEYMGHRYINWKQSKNKANPEQNALELALSNEMVNIVVMEAGIVFHSLLIGLTLVVTGDSAFMTLFIVIIFHQMFEGIALGSRIATLGTGKTSALAGLGHHHTGEHNHDKSAVQVIDSPAHSMAEAPRVSMVKKLLLASTFALVTPIGMAIGIGVLNHFNGNDKETIIAIGTLDAFSAGILLWVGLVEMWAVDWMHGEFANSSPIRTALGMFGLISGMILMSFLGKWA
ncbi:Zinc transporter 9 [Ceratocystis lukuohia]|uniref:Zinc transporter 9 n=1 Tax=Ceratocystis lukuohia TaxID=2019550 RepID=A0ABR4MNQ9_9PEZI